jgi:bile acid:Na+ symporter, BASS family
MVAEWMAQVALPWVLASVMLAMGLSLTHGDFLQVARAPRRVALGLSLQLIALPLLAWLVVLVMPLPPVAAAGLLLVSLVPGGATSNLFSYLVQGDLALSVTLTAVAALVIPFTLPLLMGVNFDLLGLQAEGFSLPYWSTVAQLVLVTLLPAAIGMSVRPWLTPGALAVWLPRIKVLTGVAMIVIVLSLFIAYRARLPALVSVETLSVLTLCVLAMVVGARVSGVFGLPEGSLRAVTVEVGVQNAGVAMLVAFAILQWPQLGLVPLLYGLMMNVPVFLWVGFLLWGDRRRALAQVATGPAD